MTSHYTTYCEQCGCAVMVYPDRGFDPIPGCGQSYKCELKQGLKRNIESKKKLAAHEQRANQD
jgi:hypothetical protein